MACVAGKHDIYSFQHHQIQHPGLSLLDMPVWGNGERREGGRGVTNQPEPGG